ncbi:hypothetical protein [Campylobacter sp.]|uniref:hypothetical protein n=1 Tax=Campylobacter sp. TaxID=205 RepID=UPI0025C559F9|nr:hypothetical protein [Campylobacter sp.]
MLARRIILIILSIVYLCFGQEIDTNKNIGEGYGQTRDEAIKNAIEDVLSTIQEITLQRFKFEFNGDFDIGYNKEIDLASKAIFNSYSVEELTQIHINKFYAKVKLYKKDHLNNIDIKQKSLIIINTITNNLSQNIEKELVKTLLEYDIFKILDQNISKSYKEQILAEVSQHKNLKEFPNPLKADFLLIITPNITQVFNENSIEYNVDIDYKIINFANNEVEFFDSINLMINSTSKISEQRVFKDIIKQIIDQIIIYLQNTFLK